MPDKAFLDTNILVYAFAVNDPRKGTAEKLMIQGAAIGVQTLNEFVNVMAGKLKESWADVADWLTLIHQLCAPIVPITLNVHRIALEIAQTYRYHFYDCLMLAAALESSCTVFYSEDLQNGHVIGGLTIRNPFA